MKKSMFINIVVLSSLIIMLILLVSKTTLSTATSIDSIYVGYDNSETGFKTSSNTDVNDVQTAIDELYDKVKDRTCPNSPFLVGDYIYMVPDVVTYTFPTSLSGYTSDQTINIGGTSDSNGLRLWRIIDIHVDGTFDAVSEYVSYDNVSFRGATGYQNYIAGLQSIAAQFAKRGYTINTRMMGYGGQSSILGTTTAFDGTTNTAPSTTSTPTPTTGTGKEYNEGVLGDNLYLKDYQLVSSVYKGDTSLYGVNGVGAYKVGTTTYHQYFLASRHYEWDSSSSYTFRLNQMTSSGFGTSGTRGYNSGWKDYNSTASVRPIITLNSGVTIDSGSGTKSDPYTLKPPTANSPDLVDGLIPVKYDETNGWVKANSANTNNDWYDYDNKKWANAVLVNGLYRNTYKNAAVGTDIDEAQVLAYYVWIPRFKYKVFNINKVINTDSYSAKTTGIDIMFENEKISSGTVKCNYDFAVTDGTLSEICNGTNGDYYTHPAFTFGDKQLRGIWVGKFEVSSEDPSATSGGGNVTTLTVRIKPNVSSWRGNKLTNYYLVISNMQASSNIYGLNTSKTNTDSHMIKNIEWGAVAYLTNSKYGRCTNNSCTEVTINNSSDYITGNAGNTVSASYAAGTINAYDTSAGQLASTTGNIYGIYDMSGGSHEYVMGNMSSASGSYTYFVSSAGSNYTYSGNEKYIDTYATGTTYNDQNAYNRSRLGDATGETKSWYSDAANFVYSTNSYSWILRGRGYNNTTGAGPFGFGTSGGTNNGNYSSRATLVSLQ